MKQITYLILFIYFTLIPLSAYPSPNEIIIIRHADKLIQPNPGPCLSAKGLERSIAFAFYYLKKFKKPDYIIATDPVNKDIYNSSIRQLQTVAPLANILASLNPKQGFPILHPYASKDYAKLAFDLLNHKKYDGKEILICWSHTKIAKLLQKLGLKTNIPKWDNSDFDTILILKYNKKGKLQQFNVVKHQYKIPSTVSWDELIKLINS